MKVIAPSESAEYLRAGKVLLVPTETVVGLVATSDGISKIQSIKGRDPQKPIALLCRDAEEAFSLAGRVPDLARKLAGLYWPGPLTLVLEARDGETVGLRVPLGIVRDVLEAYGGPLYATSANLSGEPAPEALDLVDPRVSEVVDAAIEGEAGGGEASAVVDLIGETPHILRPSAKINEALLKSLSD